MSEIHQARTAAEAVRATARATAVALALGLLAFASPALAGPPSHPRDSALDIGGFNHACGAAVDSKGDVYVSSAGESKVRVFDPSHKELTFVKDENEPCGLAVDSKGRLYVSEAKTGKVVRYTPNAYPFSGTPTYGPAEPIDSGGEAEGIAVDPFDDRLYVAEGGGIAVYQANGSPEIATNEEQRVRVIECSGGTYTLTFRGKTTAPPLAYNASSAQVDAALEALSTIGAGNVAVTADPLNFGDVVNHKVTFEGALHNTTVPQLRGDKSKLICSGFGLFLQTIEQGFSGHIGEGSLTNATGVAAYTYKVSSESADRYVSVADAAADEVKIFGGPDIKQIEPRGMIDGVDQDRDPETPEQEFGFGTAGAAVGVDWTSGHFFLYDDAHSVLDEFEASGHYLDQVADPGFADAEPTGIAPVPQRNEIQKITVLNASSGAYTLSFEGETSAPIPFNAKGSQVEAALEALPAIGADAVSASGEYTNNGFGVGIYFIAFTEALGNRDVPELTVDGSGLSGSEKSPFTEITTHLPGIGPGGLFVTAGAAAGAKLLAFGPLASPSRPPLPALSHVLATAAAVATDSTGDVYVAAGPLVHVYGPDGKEIKVGPKGEGIETSESPSDLAVDSAGNVYVRIGPGLGGDPAKQLVQYYTPASYPPKDGTQYKGPITVASGNSFLKPTDVNAIGLNPGNDHVFVAGFNGQVIELDSAAKGSPILDPCFGCKLTINAPQGIAAYGDNGDVYVSEQFGKVLLIDPSGTEVLARIGGAGSPRGPFSGNPGRLAVDQSNGHVLVFNSGRGAAEEYDASGAFVAEFGEFTSLPRPSGIAIDNSGGPTDGNAYVAFDDSAPGSFDLTAFGPLAYGEVPVAVTGIASGLGAGDATLNGAVDPRDFALEDCRFEYLTDAEYQENLKKAEPAFKGATTEPCAESPAEIGKGTGAVPVHAEISGLDPEGRYRFRLLAKNKYGESEGKAWLFGPPGLTPKTALPVLYDEATLRAEIDPSGLATKYRFEYGKDEGYGQSTPTAQLAPGDGAVPIEVPLTGLAEGTEYHFRLLAENEAKTALGPDQTFETLERAKAQECPNTEFRTGLSASLPDCRAYELVTPAETRGATPHAEGSGNAGETFNNWLTPPRGEGAGESVAYFATGLPGFDGSGRADGYRALRAADDGPHPAKGWTSELQGPTYTQVGGGGAQQHGVASDQRYWLFHISGAEYPLEETLEAGWYLRTPGGVSESKCNPQHLQDRFELVGCGELGVDPDAEGRFLAPGGAHLIFFSDQHLEEEAAPLGTLAVYDRAAGGSDAEVVSVKPDGEAFGAGEAATYVGASEDGAAVAFKVGGTLYLHRGGETVEVAPAPDAFAGIFEDGKRVFYAKAGDLYAFDAETQSSAEIAPSSTFISVSPDGSHVLFSSKEALTGAEENEAGESAEAGERNLYAWQAEGETTRFIAILDPEDFVGFGGYTPMNLGSWTSAVSGSSIVFGRDNSPTRATPGGEVFVFQSHAQLTAYENEGQGEIYRYEPAAEAGKRLLCVSCDPSGAPAAGDALLQVTAFGGVTTATTLVPNVTDDGSTIFFQSPDRLLPEDANQALDVYEWKAQGAGGCERQGGCLALVSSGQGEGPSYLYGMSADGRDVFFETPEKLVSADVPGSPSLYDARIEGGIPDPPKAEGCQGDACQGQGSAPPALGAPASTGASGGDVEEVVTKPCPKGKRKVRRGGKVRCVKKHHRRRHRANRERRAER